VSVIRFRSDVPLEQAADRAAERALDAVYVSVGLGILAFQRAQVRRREVEANVTRALDAAERLDADLDDVVARVTARLPRPVGDVVDGLHGIGRSARRTARAQLRSRLAGRA
jgi:hypothetical protein